MKNKTDFLFNNSLNQLQREKSRKLEKLHSKLFLFIKNRQICNKMLQIMVNEFSGKINDVLKIKQIVDNAKYIKVCNLFLNQNPKILRVIVLCDYYNVSRHKIFLKELISVFSDSLETQSNNFIVSIFQQKEKLNWRLLFLKLLALVISIILNESKQDLIVLLTNINNIILQLQKKLKKDELSYFYHYFSGYTPKFFSFIISNVTCFKGINELIYNYILTSYHQVENLAFEFVTKEIDFEELYEEKLFFLIHKSSKLKCQIGEVLSNQETQKSWINFYQFLKIQSNNSSYQLEILTNLITNLEINFFQNSMFQDYKNVQGQNLTYYKTMRILRKKIDYKQFLNKIQLSCISYFLNRIKSTNESSLCKFLQFVISLYQKQEQTILLSCLSKIQIIQQWLRSEQIFHTQRYLDNTSNEVLSMYCLFKFSEFQQQNEMMFSSNYLQQQEVKDQLIKSFQFFIQIVTKRNLSKTNPLLLRNVILYLKQIYTKDQVLNFYELEYDCIQSSMIGNTIQLLRNNQIIKKLPFLISFKERNNFFQDELISNKRLFERKMENLYMINEQGQEVLKPNKIIILKRGQEFQNAYEQLASKQLQHLYHVKFINQMNVVEDGIDAGGVTKEFIARVIEQAFDPQYGLFIETTERTFIPNPNCLKEDLEKYYFVGKIVGKAIYEQIPIGKVLCPIFLNQILGISNSCTDLKFYDKQLNYAIFNLNNQDVSDFGLKFSIIQDFYGNYKEFNLVKFGNEIDVNNYNKDIYIQTYCNFYLNQQIIGQSFKFQQGLEEIINSELLKLFTNLDLQLLISGQNKIDIDDLMLNTQLNDFKSSDETIQFLFEVLKEMTEIEKREFLFFFSSCSRAPVQGFQTLSPKFTIQRIEIENQNDLQKLPTASTCSNMLKLPDYKNKKLLQQKLIQAITSKTGFELI